MPTTALRARSWAALAVAVPLALRGGTATAAGSARGVLTGDTVVTWTGTAGIRLDTRGTGSLPDEAMTLTVQGGTYAFVTLLVSPQPRSCAAEAGQPHCYGFTLALFPHSGALLSAPARGHDHLTTASRPPEIIGRRLDAYLITDGRATLRLRPRGYTGRSSYVARGRIRGTARALPSTCGAPHCVSTPATTSAGGGAVYDFGRSPGHLLTIAYALARSGDPATGGNHPTNVQSCFYPSDRHPTAPADPAAHPSGCDVVPAEPGRAVATANDDLVGAAVGLGALQSWLVADVTGRRYAGFYVASATPHPVAYGGYGVWFHYGISG